MAEFKAAVAKTIEREGGDKFTNDPKDPGGPTKFGIAQAYHPGVDVLHLDLAGAQAIYRKEYWDPMRGDEVQSQFLAELLFDSAVNPGLGTTIRILQAAIGVPLTKRMDETTLQALNGADPHEAVANFLLAKIAHYVAACRKTPDKKKFFFGWVCRTLNDGGIA